jgi:nitrogen fixation-related uncharacterized protein
MPIDALVALVVVVTMFTILFGLLWWARGAPAYDDGRASTFVTYVAEPDDPRKLAAGADAEPADSDPGTEDDGPPPGR